MKKTTCPKSFPLRRHFIWYFIITTKGSPWRYRCYDRNFPTMLNKSKTHLTQLLRHWFQVAGLLPNVSFVEIHDNDDYVAAQIMLGIYLVIYFHYVWNYILSETNIIKTILQIAVPLSRYYFQVGQLLCNYSTTHYSCLLYK